MVHQSVGHAFVSHAPIMTNTIHNAIIKTLNEGGFQGYTGPAYQQSSQINFTPIESATITPPVVPQSQLEGSIGSTQPIGSIVPLSLTQFLQALHRWPHQYKGDLHRDIPWVGTLPLVLVCLLDPSSLQRWDKLVHQLYSRSVSNIMHRLHSR